MSTPRFRPNPFTDIVPRRSATSSKSGLDIYRRLTAMEQAVAANTSVDTDALNMMRLMGASVRAWAYDPSVIADDALFRAELSNQVAYALAMYLPSPATITGLMTHVQVAGVMTQTTGQVAVYDAAGTRLAISTHDANLWKTTGLVEKAFPSTIDLDRGLYYGVFLSVRSSTTTAPQLSARGKFAELNNVKTVTAFRRAIFANATSLPSLIDFSPWSSSAAMRWCGLY